MSEKPKSDAYLFGPFIGEFSWEFFRFAPYAIYLKKLRPTVSLIVLTRPYRFDLYGNYADVLVPLKLKLIEKYHKEKCFSVTNYSERDYKLIAQYFFDKYNQKYDIFGHYYPDINWRYNVKWQFPNNMMSYDFRPRKENKLLVDSIIKEGKIIYFDGVEKRYVPGYDSIDSETFKFQTQKILNSKTTYMGCLIELLKRCSLVIGNLNNDISKLAILLKVPLVDLDESTEDKIKLLNPLKTPVIVTNEIEKGIEFYENNF